MTILPNISFGGLFVGVFRVFKGGVSLRDCAIRLGEWKLIYHYKTGRKELYHLPDDVGEQHDLAAQQPQKVRKLAALLGKRLRDMQAQRPCSAATGKPFPWSDE